MCLILFAYRVHPKYPIILASNRDEFYGRPTAPLDYWEDNSGIVAGRDLEKFGTWLGVNKQGRLAAITNYRDPSEDRQNKLSRGEIPVHFLQSIESPEHFFYFLRNRRGEYPGYNFLAGSISELWYYSNIQDSFQKLEPGFYGLSNHFLNTDWPKVKIGKNALKKWVSDGGDDYSELFTLLNHSEAAKDSELPDTGIGIEKERMLSPAFIQSHNYGTRASTLVFFKNDLSVEIIERTYDKGKQGDHDRKMCFKIEE